MRGNGRTWAGVALSVAVALTAAGCSGSGGGSGASGDGGGFTIAAVAQSMTAARTVHVEVTFPTPKGSVPSTTVAGAGGPEHAAADFDFTRQIGAMREALDGQSTEVVFRGQSFYLPLDTSNLFGLPARVTAGKHWLDYHLALAPSEGPFSLNPYTQLDLLRRQHVPITDLGSARVDRQPVHHYAASMTRTESVASDRVVLHIHEDLYVDHRDRLVRTVTATTFDGKPGQPSIAQDDFSAYGAPIDVAIPPPSDVVEYSDDLTPTPRLTGGWTRVASGRSPELSWSLYRAPADVDRVCWSFESTPPLKQSAAAKDSLAFESQFGGATGKPPRHDGHDATCTRTGPWQADVEVAAYGTIGHRTVVAAILGPDVVSAKETGELILSGSMPPGVLPPGVVPPGAVPSLPGDVPSPGDSLLPPSVKPKPIPIDPRYGGFVDMLSFDGTFDFGLRNGRTKTCTIDAATFPDSADGACVPVVNAPSSATLTSVP